MYQCQTYGNELIERSKSTGAKSDQPIDTSLLYNIVRGHIRPTRKFYMFYMQIYKWVRYI